MKKIPIEQSIFQSNTTGEIEDISKKTMLQNVLLSKQTMAGGNSAFHIVRPHHNHFNKLSLNSENSLDSMVGAAADSKLK